MKTFDEWKAAVEAEIKKLRDVTEYLNHEGTMRYASFSTLDNLANFCGNAAELVEWIDSKRDLDKYEIADLERNHVRAPINALRKIAQAEKQ